jgi:hypothetical protein
MFVVVKNEKNREIGTREKGFIKFKGIVISVISRQQPRAP